MSRVLIALFAVVGGAGLRSYIRSRRRKADASPHIINDVDDDRAAEIIRRMRPELERARALI